MTWKLANQQIVKHALDEGWESSETVRVDSTVVDANIHEPSDSSLLNDGVRVLTRLLVKAKKGLGVPTIRCRDQRKREKSLAREIFYVRGKEKKKALYFALLSIVEQLMVEVYVVYCRVICKWKTTGFCEITEALLALRLKAT